MKEVKLVNKGVSGERMWIQCQWALDGFEVRKFVGILDKKLYDTLKVGEMIKVPALALK